MATPVTNAEKGKQYWLTWYQSIGKTTHANFQVWKVEVLHVDEEHGANPKGGKPCVCAPIDPAGFTQANSIDGYTNDLYETRQDALDAAKERFLHNWDKLVGRDEEMQNLGDGHFVNMASVVL